MCLERKATEYQRFSNALRAFAWGRWLRNRADAVQIGSPKKPNLDKSE